MGSPGSHSKPPLPKTRERITIRANQEGGGTHASSRSSPHAIRARQTPALSRGSQRSSLQRGMIWVGALALCSFCLLETWRRVSFLVSCGPDDHQQSPRPSLSLFCSSPLGSAPPQLSFTPSA